MAGLYERLMGWEATGDDLRKIPVHTFRALLGEVARGKLTGAQALQALADVAGEPLTTAETAEAQALLTYVQAPSQLAVKLQRYQEIEDASLLAEQRTVYSTPAAFRAQLTA